MNIDKLLLHPKTRMQCENILTRPPHGLLLAGPAGSGKASLAYALAAQLVGCTPEELLNYAYFHNINPEGASISIEDIRALQQFLKLKVPSHQKSGIQRIIIIHIAERMRHEAQNALLKTLEEPPTDTVIFLTANHEQALLPTINSRVVTIPVLPVGQELSEEYFVGRGFSKAAVSKQYALARGQVGLLATLLGEESHPLLEAVNLAKKILTEPIGQRLKQVDEIAKDKQLVTDLLDALDRISHAAIVAASSQNKLKAVEQWHQKQTAVLQALEALRFNPNIKLLLDDLFLAI